MKAGGLQRKKTYIFVLVVLFSIAAGEIAANRFVYGPFDYYDRLRTTAINSIERELVIEIPLPSTVNKEGSKSTTYIYVLGGNQDTLLHRFRKAATLYREGISKKILILSRPGITEFSPELGRNWTNDEWGIRELERLNVRKEDVEPVSVKKNGFGTLSEAKNISDIAPRKGCKRLILVTSTYHTRRAYNAFIKYAANKDIEIYIYGADDSKELQDLLLEYVKLIFYNNYFAISGDNG
jgi:hypothetical protein